MILKDISFLSPRDNLLYDEVLLNVAETKGCEFLRFWESENPFIVLGRISKPFEDLIIKNIQADQVEVLRRCSGGGTVVQGAGCLNFSLVFSKDKHPEIADLKRSYEYILSRLAKGLKQAGANVNFYPISDVALVETQKKVSGNSQKRGRNAILHHGTLLYDFDLSLIEKYLAMPRDIPEYRKSRPHRDFVDNLRINKEDIKKHIKEVFDVSSEEKILDSEKLLLEAIVSKRELKVALESVV